MEQRSNFERGVLDSHISSLTGERVFNIFDLISPQQNELQMINVFKDSIYKLKTGWAKFNYYGEGMVF